MSLTYEPSSEPLHISVALMHAISLRARLARYRPARGVIHKSMSLTYEPSSEPLHISAWCSSAVSLSVIWFRLCGSGCRANMNGLYVPYSLLCAIFALMCHIRSCLPYSLYSGAAAFCMAPRLIRCRANMAHIRQSRPWLSGKSPCTLLSCCLLFPGEDDVPRQARI